MITRGDVRVREGESCGGNGGPEVVGGWVFDVALFATAESLRSRLSSEVAAVIGVVLRGVRCLPIRVSLKTRRSVDFVFAKTAGCREFHKVTAGL
jgi:hypothetical protein